MVSAQTLRAIHEEDAFAALGTFYMKIYEDSLILSGKLIFFMYMYEF